MVMILHVVGSIVLLAAGLIGVIKVRSTDLISGGVKPIVGALKLPVALYFVGIAVTVADIVDMGTANSPAEQILPAFFLVFLFIASSGMFFSAFLVTVKGQLHDEAAGSVIDALRKSQNETANVVGQKAAENLNTRATDADELEPERSATDEEPSEPASATADQPAAASHDSATAASAKPESSTPATTGSQAETSTDEPGADVDAGPSEAGTPPGRLRRFELSMYLLATPPVLLLGYGLVQTGLLETATAGTTIAVLLGISLLTLLVGVGVRKRWSVAYYVGIWMCGIYGALGVYGLVNAEATGALGALLLVALPGIFWGANSKQYF
ncbi:hypothetical protein [Haloparvum sp. PAK95]|uniref:hypothetical protein n=1 Tax=Haloparvum sp. PAK95 TaxID=3418962 RepID=UPI003D2ECC80